MPKVIYDGETVVFEGKPPENLGMLVELLRHNAANTGKFILTVKVDGTEISWSDIDRFDKAYKTLEVQSGSDKELFLKAIDGTLKRLPEIDAALEPILESLLSDSWETAFSKLNAFFQGLAPMLELMANLTQYAQRTNVEWKAELAKQISAIETLFAKVLKQCENQQVAELTSSMNFDMRPVYAGCIELIKGPIRATFAK